MAKNYYTVKEVAEYFSLTPNTIYRHIRKRKIRAIKVIGARRIHLDEIQKFERRRKKH
jgi:excisionase family DNA binding protein